MGNFIFNGVSAADMGLNVERFPRMHDPERRIESYRIPGRQGDLTQWDGTYEPYIQEYECWFRDEPLYTMSEKAHRIKRWLGGSPTKARLEDTYDPGVFHEATYLGGAEIENIRNRYGRFTVRFRVDPRAFLHNDEDGILITAPRAIINLTDFSTYPLLEVIGSTTSTGVVTIGEHSVNFLTGYETSVWFDCEIREAWQVVDGEIVPTNASISSPSIPRLDPGANRVSFSGVGIEAVRVFPRWWQL